MTAWDIYIGKSIAFLRAERSVDLREITAVTGIGVEDILRIESGHRCVVSEYRAVCAAMGVDYHLVLFVVNSVVGTFHGPAANIAPVVLELVETRYPALEKLKKHLRNESN